MSLYRNVPQAARIERISQVLLNTSIAMNLVGIEGLIAWCVVGDEYHWLLVTAVVLGLIGFHVFLAAFVAHQAAYSAWTRAKGEQS